MSYSTQNDSTESDSSQDFPEMVEQQRMGVRSLSSIFNIYETLILPNVGISLLILSQFFNSIMVTTCKLLVTDKDFNTPIHPVQILFVRMAITYVCCIAYMYITKSVPDYPFGKPEIRRLLVLRGAVGFFGVFGLYYLLQYLSLSDAVAITFLIPMVTAFLAWLMINENYSWIEAICGVASLGGVILIAKPDFIFGNTNETNIDENIESLSTEKRLLATTVGLIGVVGASSVYIILRKIGKRAHPLLSVSYFSLICVVFTFLLLLILPDLSFALPQNNYQWFLFAVIGFSGFFMQFSLTAGVQRVKATRASLITYTHMVFAILWDLVIWGHFPGILSLLGILIILGMATAMIYFKPECETTPQPNSDIERSSNKYKQLNNNKLSTEDYNDSIALQDFNITDESDNESSNRNHNT